MERVEHSDLLCLWLLETCRGEEEGAKEEISLYPYSAWFTSLLQEVSRKVVDDRDTALSYLENMVLIPLIGWEIYLRKPWFEYKGSMESFTFAEPMLCLFLSIKGKKLVNDI